MPKFAKRIIALVILLGISLYGRAHEEQGVAASNTPLTASYSQRVLLKNWALSTCLGKIANNETMQKDAAATAGAYLEFGSQGPEVYEQISLLIQKYVKRRYQGAATSEFNTMKCIDLYHSKALDSLLSRIKP
jgi:hypothetical protein